MNSSLLVNMIRRRSAACALSALAALLFVGCGKEKDSPATGQTAKQAVSLPAALFLAKAPENVVPVKDVKASAAAGDQVVVRAVVGGRKNPFVEGRAMWTAVEASLYNACTRPGHGCSAPWDYCCADADELGDNMVTIQVLGADGKLLPVDLTSSTQLAPMTTLVVEGTVAQKPDSKALIVSATGIFVEAQE